MKKSWMIFLLTPILIFSAYPIYDEEIDSEQELLLQDSQSSSEKDQSAITNRNPTKRNSSMLQSKSSSRSKFRDAQNPDRPRVTHRNDKKKQNLSKIEADAEEMEEGLSVQQDEEHAGQTVSPSQKEKGTTAQKKGPNKQSPKTIEPQSKADPNETKKPQGNYPRKRLGGS
jgi:hypothetical protein